jgi:hypothetical protein
MNPSFMTNVLYMGIIMVINFTASSLSSVNGLNWDALFMLFFISIYLYRNYQEIKQKREIF